jgi:uncharacterized MAPEG superfamily protein
MLMPYESAMVALLVLASLILVQVLVADYASIKAQHVPGMPVTSGHASFHFRAVRALGNTNETLGLFLLVFGLAVLFAAWAQWVNGLVWVYVAARAGHMIFYYLRRGFIRSIFFGFSLGATAGLLAVTLTAAFT